MNENKINQLDWNGVVVLNPFLLAVWSSQFFVSAVTRS